MWIYLSLAVAVAGAVVFFAASKPETKEIGRLSFIAGLVAFLLTYHSALHLP